MLEKLKRSRITAVMILTIIILMTVVSISIAVESSAPTITALSPQNGITVTNSTYEISVNVTDPNLIANSNYFIKLNGTTLASQFQYGGYWETDSCSGATYWVQNNYAQATISSKVTALKDGLQSVEVQVLDRLGNAATQTWTFNVAVKPILSEFNPAADSTAIINNTVSAKILDNDQVDVSSIKLVVDNNPVTATAISYNSATGLLNYTIPAPGLANGAHTAIITANDTAGNESSKAWSFNVQAVGQPLTFADSGKILTTASPVFSVKAIANTKLDSAGATMVLDGKSVGVDFTYKGHWVPQEELDPYWQIDSYNEATISANSTGLKDGAHTLAVTAKDVLGNQFTNQWNFSVNELPIFTTAYPAKGQNTTDSKGFSIKVTDNDGVVPNSVVAYLDGAMVPSTFDAATGTIAYQPAVAIANGTHTVNVTVKDTTGNTANFSWTYTVQVIGPEITFANDGQTLDTYQPALSVAVKSNVKIVATSMKIDGQLVDAGFTYKGHTEYPMELDPEWVVDSYNEGILAYIPTLLDGVHEMVVDTKDILGNQSAKTFTFSIAQKPIFSGIEPVNGFTTSTRTPTIKATIVDPNGTIVKGAVKLLLDSNPVVPTITDTDTGINISFTTGSLSIDKYHNIALTATDNSGNTNSIAWKFYVNTKGDMPITATDCGSCHTLNQYTKYEHDAGPLGVTSANPSPTHFYGGSCNHCHGSYSEQTCGYCHNGDISLWWDGDGWVRPTPEPEPAISAGQDCLYCHSGNNAGWVPSPYAAGHYYFVKNIVNNVADPFQPLYPDLTYTLTHDILPTHQIDKGSCNECHSNYLTREHNKKNRNGEQITCASCHASSDPKVQQAIAAKNLDCLACHTSADHEAVHNDELDNNCQTCHKGSLTTEHMNNSITTAGKNLSCDTCHASTNQQVKRALSWSSVSCASCHNEGHNIVFATKAPADIPLYAGFQWTSPIEANIYTNEPVTTFEYAGGQVVVSNRMTGVNASEIWNFYNGLLTTNGWIAKSGVPSQTAQYFATTFAKDSRQVLLKCYNTETSDGSGESIASGYRVELWYK